jgi:hypothetical protein
MDYIYPYAEAACDLWYSGINIKLIVCHLEPFMIIAAYWSTIIMSAFIFKFALGEL